MTRLVVNSALLIVVLAATGAMMWMNQEATTGPAPTGRAGGGVGRGAGARQTGRGRERRRDRSASAWSIGAAWACRASRSRSWNSTRRPEQGAGISTSVYRTDHNGRLRIPRTPALISSTSRPASTNGGGLDEFDAGPGVPNATDEDPITLT